MKDIIQKLKDNEKAFGLMSVPMINRAESIGKKQFEIWGESNDEDDTYTWLSFGDDGDFDPDRTYRLREDYTEPETGAGVEKCEVYRIGDKGSLVYKRCSDKPWNIHNAVAEFDFIGFLYEGGCVSSLPRIYRINDGIGPSLHYTINESKINEDGYEVLTPTHVLFKSK